MAITGGPPSGQTDLGPYGLGDQGHQGVSHGYEFFGLGRTPGSTKPMTVNGALNTFIRYATGTPQQRAAFAQIQNYLYLGGFYSSKSYVPTYGGYRTEDLAAMKKALLSASAGKGPGKTPLADFFTGMANAYQRYNAPGPKAPVLTIQQTDPTDIRRVIERVAPDVIGEDLTDDEKGRIIDAFRGIEADRQRQAFAAQTGAGGTYDAPPDLEGFVADEAKRLHPNDAHAKSLANAAKSFMSMFGGSPETAQF